MEKLRILLLDNYDSYTFNLRQYLEEEGECEIYIVKNDQINPSEAGNYDAIVLSPGPGLPSEAGKLLDVIRFNYTSVPILGICLGQQAVAEVFGGELYNLEKVCHGLSTEINILDTDHTLFKDLPRKIPAGRYHSWVVTRTNFPKELVISAVDENDQIMAIRHKELPIYAVQFHPESILTPNGRKMISNFMQSLVQKKALV